MLKTVRKVESVSMKISSITKLIEEGENEKILRSDKKFDKIKEMSRIYFDDDKRVSAIVDKKFMEANEPKVGGYIVYEGGVMLYFSPEDFESCFNKIN